MAIRRVKLLHVLLALTLVFSVGFAPASVAAGSDPVQDFVNRLINIYKGMGPDGVAALEAVRAKLNSIKDEKWDSILTVNGKNVKETIDAKVGKGKAQQIISDLVAIVYGTDEDLQKNVNDFRTNYADEFDSIFGTQLTVDKLFAFFNKFEEELEDRVVLAVLKEDSDLETVIRDAAHAAAEKENLDGALYNALQIGVDDVLQIVRNVNDEVDPKKEAREALVMGLAKYKNITITGPSTVTVGQTAQYKISTILNGAAFETSGGVQWKTSDSAKATIDQNGRLTARATGMVNVEAWVLGYKIAEKAVTVNSASSGGGGGGGSGSSGSGGGDGGSTSPVVNPGEAQEKVIDTQKGDQLSTTDGAVTITVPAGAIVAPNGKPVKVALQTLGQEEAAKRVETILNALQQSGLQKESDRFEIAATVLVLNATDADGQAIASFNKNVTLQIKIDPNAVKDLRPELLSLYRVVGVKAETAAKSDLRSAAQQPVLEYVPSIYKPGVGLVAKVNKPGEFVVAARVKAFADVTPSHYGWAKEDIEFLAAKELVKGRTETQFVPQGTITRAEFAALMVRLLDVKASGKATMDFVDYNANAWYADALKAAVEAGLLRGDGGKKTIRPNAPISRAEMAAILVRVLEKVQLKPNVDTAKELAVFADSSKIPAWAKTAVAEAVASGLVKGYPDKTFRPDGQATRAEAAAMLKRLFEQVFDKL